LTGHAYSRALRAHILAHLALAKIVLSKINFSEKKHLEMIDILSDVGITYFIENIEASSKISNILNIFSKILLELETNGATAKLWIQYFHMVTLVKQFIQAERSGNWNLHLQCIQDMFPYFHASGHFLYAKSCHLYLQDMQELKSKLSNLDYKRFVTKGYFTIRRSDKFWSGIWSDMTIKQTLMRSMKSNGGLTHGRGITACTMTKWINSMTTMIDISQQIEQFCGVSFATTEQHVDARTSRISRDTIDVNKFFDWFKSHDPFTKSENVMSISTGVIEDKEINCHLAYEIGIESMSNVIGSNFFDKSSFSKKIE